MTTWEPGTVYMEYVEAGQKTLTSHRCWNVSTFRHARMEQAALATTKGKLSTVRFMGEAEYRTAGGQ